MNVSVARFQGAAVRDGGIILLANDGAANVLLDAAPGANSRIDVIYSKQNDASGTVTVPDANNTALLTFVKGTAGAVPVKPTLPVGALELATVLIPSGATATNSAGVVITQTAQFTASSGGTVSVRNLAERNAGSWVKSQTVLDLATDIIWFRSSTSTWRAQTKIVAPTSGSVFAGAVWDGTSPLFIQAGRVAGTATGGSGLVGTFPIAFPNGLVSITANIYNAGGVSGATLRDAGSTLSGPNFQITTAAGGSVAGTSQSYSYTAVGW
jgi:hypothetical protein